MQNAFLHVPKTGGMGLAPFLPKGVRRLGHNRLSMLKDLDKLCVYAFVRNPFDRLVSAWAFLGQGGAIPKGVEEAAKLGIGSEPSVSAFREFVARMYAVPKDFMWQTHMITQWVYLEVRGEVMANWLGRFENFETDVKLMMQILGGTWGGEQQNESQHEPWRNYYDETTASAVAEIYKVDFQAFDYSTESWKSD